MSNFDSTTPPAAAAVETGTAERESTIASVSALNRTQKCEKKRKMKTREQQDLPPDLDATEAAEAEGQVEAKQNGMQEQEATDTAASALNGTRKYKKMKKKRKMLGRQELLPDLDSTPKAEGQVEAKGNGVQEQEAANAAASALNGTQKRKKKKKKMKKNKMLEQQELPPDLDSTGAAEAEEQVEAKRNGVQEQEATVAAASALNGTQKHKRKKKKKKNKMLEQQELLADLDSTKAVEVEGQVDAKGNGLQEQEATNAAASALSETQKCKKKKNKMREQQKLPPDLDSRGAAEAEGQVEAKGNRVQEQEATNATASAIEATPKRREEAKMKVSVMPQEEVNATVSVSESTPKHKKRRKNKMQKQLDSAKASSDVVAVDIFVSDKSKNGCGDVVGVSGHADVNMDPINGDDPSSVQSKANGADVLVKNNDGNRGIKNCAGNSGLLQSSAGRRRRGKRKWGSSNGGPGFSSETGSMVAKHGRHSSTHHDLSCICDLCSVEAHKEKIQNIYSPRGSLVRFQRKKLLILDLNGLLADINQDYQNAHLAHAKVRAKLVFKRPYCDDFLRFCFENFELGIWSSRKRENVQSVVDILMRDLKQYLLFCWDMSHCTVTGCKTIDNKDKPLVLKELKKLWNKEKPNLPWDQGEFSPSNTLLVDDSPYKALCNPPNTAIFPEPYSYLNRMDDYSLGPGGDLRVYLERIAAADSVQSFVQDNPFGQNSITESDPNWNFYVKIVDKVGKKIDDTM